jgi:hypothetical protein
MWPGGTYDPKVPTPESILGYKIGAQHTPHYLIEKFIFAIAESSDRVIVRKLGKTYQGREQYSVVISSPANLAKLDEIRADLRKLIDVSLSQEEVNRIAAETPAVAMINYTVHGNEGSGCEAGLRTIYQLAAGTDEATLKVLDKVVTVINPVQNPDGHERYVNTINGYLVAEENPNTDSMEHQEPWPGGRSNAYYFDLNRDWVLETQIETRQRVRELLYWMPQVAPDLHEMGTDSTYYFAPPMKPVNFVNPEVTRKWWEIFGQANAAAFDRFGWTYYTRESFDEFYPGYGGSLPSLLGCVAMTYEQASPRGRISERRDETILTLHEAVWHHFIASMATLTALEQKREERLQDFHKYFIEIVKRGNEGPIKEFYIPPADPVRFNKFVERLQMVGGKVYLAKSSFKVKAAYDFFTRKTGEVTLPAGTAIVPLNQAAGAVLTTILEPDPKLEEDFLKEERERVERNEYPRFYDVTAWALPLTYGIQAYWSGEKTAVQMDEVPASGLQMPERAPVPKARVAYLIPPDTNANIALVGRLMFEDFRVRVAEKKFKLGGREYLPGTAVLLAHRNPETLNQRLNELIKETGGYAVAADTGYTGDEGIDLGSEYILAIRKPKIAVLADEPTSSSCFGSIRYLFEQVYKFPYTALKTSRFARVDLNDYNVLIMPDAWGRGNFGYKAMFGKGGVEKLKRWVQEGGVLICIGGAVDFAIDDEVKLSAAPKYTQKRKEPGDVEGAYEKPAAPATGGEEKPKEEKGKKEEKKFEVERLLDTPGAIVKVMLDDRSFLSWGYGKSLAALLSSSNVFVPITDDQGIAAGVYAPEAELRIAGFIWEEMLKLLPGKAYAWQESAGRGQVICFAEEPTFRAGYDGLDRLFFNAVLFSLAYAP